VTYFATGRLVGAIREADGTPVWRRQYSGYLRSVKVGRGFIVASESNDKLHTLHLLSQITGKDLAKRPLKSECLALATAGNSIYAMMGSGTLDSFDSKLQPGASIRLSAKPIGRMSDAMVLVGSTIVVGLEDQGFVAYDLVSRRKLWEQNDKYACLYPMVVAGDLVLLRGEHSGVFNLRTGKRVWTPSEETEWTVASGSIALSEEKDVFVARDFKTGKELWRLPGGEEGSRSNDMGITSTDGSTFLVAGKSLMAISKSGKQLWTSSLALPVIARPDLWISTDGERVMAFRRGQPIVIPADEEGKRKLALRLVKDYETLDDTERDLLIPLSRFAIGPFLELYAKWAAEYEANSDEKRQNDPLDRGQILYGLLEFDTARRLDKMLTKADTDLLIQTIGKVQSEWWRDRVLVPLMMQHGDLERATPFFVAQLRKNKKPEEGDSSLEVIGRSKHPDAVKFLLDALADPKAPEPWRVTAFVHLAGTGGDDGVRAVKAAWPVRRVLKPWEERVEIMDRRGTQDRKEAKDTKGRTWVFFHSSVLGNFGDCFIAEKTGAKLGRPYFIGLFTRDLWDQKAPKEFRGIPVAKFLATEWIKILPDDETIRLDGDSDGLTDLVEQRLGTDPAKADTDGDGTRDDVDPCPNAAPREKGDREKIVEASVAARFFMQDWGTPAVIDVDKVGPFELYGYAAPLVWATSRKESPLGSVYAGGVNVIGFHNVDRESGANSDWVTFSDNGTTARTTISRYSGGLNGDGIEVVLKKIGDEWFVVDLLQRYVS
jgi:hypothetical protein